MIWQDEAVKLKQQGLELKEIQKKLGMGEVHYKTFQKNLWRYEQKIKVKFEDKKPEPTEADITNYYEALKSINKAIDKLDTKQTKMTVTIDDNKPIGIVFWGDWHIGSRGVDYKQFDADRELIEETEGLYAIGTGDYKENQMPTIHAAGTFEQTAAPGMQDLLVKSFFNTLEGKILAAVRGCHDDWDKKLSDQDFIADLCKNADCVNLWHGGGVNIKLGEQLYKIRVRHKYTGESQINTTNSQRRLLDAFARLILYV